MAGEIEFLDSEPPEPAAPEPTGRGGRRRPDVRWVSAVVAALAVAALVLFALKRPGQDGGSPAAQRPAPIPVASSAPSTPLGGAHVNIVCRTGAAVSRDIAAAMRRFFPELTVRSLGAYRCVRGRGADSRTVFEAVSGLDNGVNIDVETTQRGSAATGVAASPQLGSNDHHLTLLARTEAIGVGLQVDVFAYGAGGRPPPVDRMRALGDYISLNVVL